MGLAADTAQAETVQLNAAIASQDAAMLELRYALRNHGADRIYLFGPPLYYGPGAQLVRDDTRAWVFLEGAHTARLVRGLLAPPLAVSVARRPPIVVVPVEAGAVHEGRIRLALPLAESSPYFPAADCDLRSARSVSALRLQLGWVEARAGMALGQVAIAGDLLPRLSGGWGTPLQRVAEVELPVAGVPLCPHPAPFDRPALQR